MAKIFSTVFNNFKGIDQRAGCSVDMNATPSLINFRITENGALQKRPGFVTVDTFPSTEIGALWNGILGGVDTTLVAAGQNIYRYLGSEREFLGTTVGTVTQFVKYNNKVYCMGCSNFYVIDNNGMSVAEAYVPVVATAVAPDGSGTVFEQPNRLTTQRRVLFCPDGVSKTFKIPETGVMSVDKVAIGGATISKTQYSIELASCTVTFNNAPSEGINTLEITYSVYGMVDQLHFLHCTHGVVFENRLFIYGEPGKENLLYHSSLADGIPDCTYFAEGDYHSFNDNITGLTPCYNRLLIYFRSSTRFTYAEMFTDSLGNTRTTFPVFELNANKGTVQIGLCTLMQNTPVTLCEDGLNRWVSTYIADERSAEPFSQRMFRFFHTAITGESKVSICNRKNKSELWVATPSGIAIYNYKLDCFYLYSVMDAVSLCEAGKNMLVARRGGILVRLTEGMSFDDKQTIFAAVTFPFCTFGTPFMLKSISDITLDFEGSKEFDANITVSRGNRTETQTLYIKDNECNEANTRRIRTRCPLKRFYSCNLIIETTAEDACINAVGFVGCYVGGGFRVH